MASNALRGGKNIYSAMCLQGNWAEERHEPHQQAAATVKAQQLPPNTAKTWSKTSETCGAEKKDEMAKKTITTLTDSWLTYQKAEKDMYTSTTAKAYCSPNDKTVVEKFRKVILGQGGAAGLHALSRMFIRMDKNKDRQLSLEELERGLNTFGGKHLRKQLTKQELQQMLIVLDKNLSGKISFDEFVVGVRGEINPRREKMIMMAFKVLDKTGDGTVTIEDISMAFNSDFDPDVIAGKKKPEAALTTFLAQFDTVEADGIVTKEEFLEYYKNVSSSIDNDDYFELMIRNAWHIPGGEGWSENTSNLRVLVVFTDGRQEVHMVEDDLGLDHTDKKAIKKRLERQGIKGISEIQTCG